MLTLALETTDRNNSVALLDGDTVVYQSDYQSYSAALANSDRDDSNGFEKKPPGSSSLLVPMIKACFDITQTQPADLSLICVTQGPGMFTSLRVGVVTAKTIAFASDLPIVAVNTLDAMACQSASRHQLPAAQTIRVAVNAQRQQVFTDSFQVTAPWTAESQNSAGIVDSKRWPSLVKAGEFLTGTGLETIGKDQLQRLAGEGSTVESERLRGCDAVSIARVAKVKFDRGVRDDLWKLTPFYFRPSAAEETQQRRERDKNR